MAAKLSARFGANLLLLLALLGLPMYMWVEISMNTVLVQLYATGLETLLGRYAELAEHVELIGRIVSSFGLALAITLALPAKLFALHRFPFIGIFSRRALLFVMLWIASVPMLRITVDQFVMVTSAETKLAAVRSLLFKEVLDRKLAAFDNADAMNAIIADDERRSLLVALLPSLALISPAVDSTIKAQTEQMVVTLMKRDQEAYFNNTIFPVYQRARAQYDREWQKYSTAKTAVAKIRRKYTDYNTLNQLYNQLQHDIDSMLAREWLLYQQGFDQEGVFVAPLAARYLSLYRQQIKLLRNQKCYNTCLEDIRQQWHQYLQNEIDAGRLAGIALLSTEDEPWLYHKYIAGITVSFTSMLKDARSNFLKQRFPFDDNLEQYQFVQRPEINAMVLQLARQNGYQVADNWTRSDASPIRRALQSSARVKMDKAWRQYSSNSKLALTTRSMDKVAFAQHSVTRAMLKQTLGTHFFNNYQRYTGRDALYQHWQASLDNTNFVRMLTDAAAKSAFAPGGMFYEIGSDAVRLSFIPPVAITASLFAILSLLIQFGGACYRRHSRLGQSYVVLLGVGIVFVLGSGINHKNSFAMAMTEFSEQSLTLNMLDKTTATLLGGILDIEEWLLDVTGGNNLDSIDALFREQAKSVHPHKLYQVFTTLDLFDENIRALALWSGQIQSPYDFNVAVIKRDSRLAFYAGLNYDSNGKLEALSLPNVLASSEMGYLLDQKWFIKPDLKQDALLLLQSFNSTEGWKEIKHLGRVSMRELIEQQALKWLQHSPRRQVQRIHDSFTAGYNNLIFVQLGRGNRYECFQLPTLTINNLLAMSRQQAVAGQKRFACTGELF